LVGIRLNFLTPAKLEFCFFSEEARVAKSADAPDLGFQNRRFQNIPFRFKKQPFYERKSRVFREIELSANGE